MTWTTWMRAALLLSVGHAAALAQAPAPLPKELQGWEHWVQHDQEFFHCPFFANTDGAAESARVCAWPGRLDLNLEQSGGRFTQVWSAYADAWLALPGNLEHWPSAVTVNGAAAAVVARDGIPYIRVQPGIATVAGRFTWTQRPDSLPVPHAAGLISLTLDGHRQESVDRPNDAVSLGKRHEAEAARQLTAQIYRLLSDGIPIQLVTKLSLEVAGDAREETLPSVLPPGFMPLSLDSELPVRLDADGRLRVQARAGTWTVSLTARAVDTVGAITIPAAPAAWPNEEIWSYAADDHLRVAGLEGAEGIDPAQANVPEEWRRYPSFRVTAGAMLHLVERSRGMSPQESNHLQLQRELYLDFAHHGFTAIDQLSGQMRSGWRLDMHAPYHLLRAASGTDNLLVTQDRGTTGTGVEIRSSALTLTTVAQLAVSGGTLPASGWSERMDRVTGVLNLPPGHRLLAALGTDHAPDAWVERWGLLDLFLLLIAAAVTLRLFGAAYAAVTLGAVLLLHQENTALVWLILLVLITVAAGRSVTGWPRSAVAWLRHVALALLLVVSVPFAITQVRFALYPQLADPGGPVVPGEMTQLAAVRADVAFAKAAPFAPMSVAPPAPAPALEEIAVTGARRAGGAISSASAEPRQRYAPGTSVQAGPGVPHWRYTAYDFSWSGPVEVAQTVHFIILSPWLVGLWRVLGVLLLALLFLRLLRGSLDLKAMRHDMSPSASAAACVLALACTVQCAPSHAYSTPDPAVLTELKTRLAQPPKCVPDCADIMAARLEVTRTTLVAALDVAALSTVAVALPSIGTRSNPDSVSVDGTPVQGVFRDADQQLWIALKAGAHHVLLTLHLPAADSIQLAFPQVPHGIAVSAAGWEVSGVNAGHLVGNTVELLRRHVAGEDAETAQGPAQFSPFARIRREFALDLDWSVATTVSRIAPEKGGFTLEIPLLVGEAVLTNGIDTQHGTRVLAGFDSDADEFGWRSALPTTDALTLTAAKDKPWSEVWVFKVSPLWHVAFSGISAALPQNMGTRDWTFEYFPRSGESLTLNISRPTAAPGSTLAFDSVGLEFDVGSRSTNAQLQLSYRSTQGGRHTLHLPESARVTAVTVDGEAVPVRPEKGQLPLALLPGAHQVAIRWQLSDGATLRTQFPDVDVALASSNVSTVVRLPSDRWILLVGGTGVGPAILYWGELLLFVVLAFATRYAGRTPLRTHEWLLLGLGLSTFSWSALLLFAVWIVALRWRDNAAVESMSRRQFNGLQTALLALSFAAVVSLVAAIPYGLLASPDMRIAGLGQSARELTWFNDQATGVLPTPWVLSVSLWWYKAAMLLWALWLAFALVRWLPSAWHTLGRHGFWRKASAIR